MKSILIILSISLFSCSNTKTNKNNKIDCTHDLSDLNNMQVGRVCFFENSFGDKLTKWKKANGDFLLKESYPEYNKFMNTYSSHYCNEEGCNLPDTRGRGNIVNRTYVKVN